MAEKQKPNLQAKIFQCLPLILFAAVLLSLLIYSFYAPDQKSAPGSCYDETLVPAFTDPAAKIAVLSNENYTHELFSEAVALEPLLNKSGTQVHMGFWSSRGNHGSLVRLLDDINNYASVVNGTPQRAIWDEGTQSSLQYPAYVMMNAREHWYERTAGKNGTVLIYGVNYSDPYPVTFQQADDVWGTYSKRYVDMAALIKNATGKPVEAWCFVQGAKANRVFYTYEFPELAKLEKQGIVRLHFAKNQDADWRNPSDWDDGAASAKPQQN